MINNFLREASSITELEQGITRSEWSKSEGNRAGCKLDIFELVAALEYVIANSFEVFVADDAFEGGTVVERQKLDDFELIGKGNAFEGGTVLECAIADSFEVFVADDALERGAFAKSA